MRKQQSGAVLVLTLIALVILLISGVAMMRSNEGSSIIAGNVAFKEGAVASAEIGVQTAFAYVRDTDDLDSAGQTYYPTALSADKHGLPDTVTWTSIPAEQVGNYQVRQIVERLCTTTPVTDPMTQCSQAPFTEQSSQKLGAAVYNANSAIFYRTTVQVTGPRNTTVYIQSLFTKS